MGNKQYEELAGKPPSWKLAKAIDAANKQYKEATGKKHKGQCFSPGLREMYAKGVWSAFGKTIQATDAAMKAANKQYEELSPSERTGFLLAGKETGYSKAAGFYTPASWKLMKAMRDANTQYKEATGKEHKGEGFSPGLREMYTKLLTEATKPTGKDHMGAEDLRAQVTIGAA